MYNCWRRESRFENTTLTSGKWAAIAKCSPDTALRDITQLLALGALKKSPGGGRSTGYELTDR
ncbi:MAG: hypothetical protein LBV29_00570 [Azoarcus sp.]|nr:hypothetical protein [Azoarcus sp.]